MENQNMKGAVFGGELATGAFIQILSNDNLTASEKRQAVREIFEHFKSYLSEEFKEYHMNSASTISVSGNALTPTPDMIKKRTN